MADTQPTSSKSKRLAYRRTFDYWLLWLLVLSSIAFNVYLVRVLLSAQAGVRRIQVEAAEQLLVIADEVAAARTAVIEYNVEIHDEIPINISVPIQLSIPVTIEAQIPVDTIVTTNIPIINRPVNIPITTSIPVNLSFEVPIDETIVISETIPINLDIPIEIAILDTPFADTLETAYNGLVSFAAQLSGIFGDESISILPIP